MSDDDVTQYVAGAFLVQNYSKEIIDGQDTRKIFIYLHQHAKTGLGTAISKAKAQSSSKRPKLDPVMYEAAYFFWQDDELSEMNTAGLLAFVLEAERRVQRETEWHLLPIQKTQL